MVTHKKSVPLQYGFTLTELMISLAIGAILLTMAVPAFSTMLEENRLITHIYNFVGQLNYAREVAVTTNRSVTLCKSSDGVTCNNDLEWEDGWILFFDTSSDHQRTADETLLRVQQRAKSTISIRYSASLGHNNYVIFRTMGNSAGNGTFTFCSDTDKIVPRAVVIARTGRVRITRKKPDGTPLNCPE